MRPESGRIAEGPEEEDLEQDPEEEGRHGHADDRDDADAGVDGPPLPASRQEAERQADRDGDEHRRRDELERGWEAPQDLVEDRLLGRDRRAPVPGEHVAHVGRVLGREWLVEPERDAGTLDLLRTSARPDGDGRGVDGDDAREEEGDDRYARQDEGRRGQPAGEELGSWVGGQRGWPRGRPVPPAGSGIARQAAGCRG